MATGRLALLLLVCTILACCDSSKSQAARRLVFRAVDAPFPPPAASVKAKAPARPNTRYAMERISTQSSFLIYRDGKQQRRITDDLKGDTFYGAVDVTSAAGVTTYARHIEYGKNVFNYGRVLSSELDVLQEGRVRKVLSNSEPGVRQLSPLPPLIGVFIDSRGDLYALDDDRTLCVVRDGQLIATATLTGLQRQAAPGAPVVPLIFELDGDDFLALVKPAYPRPATVSYPTAEAIFKIDLQ